MDPQHPPWQPLHERRKQRQNDHLGLDSASSRASMPTCTETHARGVSISPSCTRRRPVSRADMGPTARRADGQGAHGVHGQGWLRGLATCPPACAPLLLRCFFIELDCDSDELAGSSRRFVGSYLRRARGTRSFRRPGRMLAMWNTTHPDGLELQRVEERAG